LTISADVFGIGVRVFMGFLLSIILYNIKSGKPWGFWLILIAVILFSFTCSIINNIINYIKLKNKLKTAVAKGRPCFDTSNNVIIQ
jgi:hypothetical protein